jgi:hypothetical protein
MDLTYRLPGGRIPNFYIERQNNAKSNTHEYTSGTVNSQIK